MLAPLFTFAFPTLPFLLQNVALLLRIIDVQYEEQPQIEEEEDEADEDEPAEVEVEVDLDEKAIEWMDPVMLLGYKSCLCLCWHAQ